MKNSLKLLFVFFQFFQAHAQNIMVCDAKTHDPIPFATVLFDNSGVYANQYGKIGLKDGLNKNEIVTFSAVGYTKKNIHFAELKDTVFLEPKTVSLEEVFIYDKKDIFEIKKTHHPRSYGSYPLVSGTELIAVIFPKKELLNAHIESATFYFEKPRGLRRYKDKFKGGKAYVFINVYRVKNGKPLKKIYTTPALEVAVMEDDKLLVDLDAANLKISENGLGFGIEYISVYTNDGKKRDFSIRPALTDEENEFYSAKTYKSSPLKINGGMALRNFSDTYEEYRSLLMSFKVFVPKE